MNAIATQAKVALIQPQGEKVIIKEQAPGEPKESFLRSDQVEGLKEATVFGVGGALVFGIPTAIGVFAPPLLAFPAVAAATAWICSKDKDNIYGNGDSCKSSFALTLGLTAIGACAGVAGLVGVAALPMAMGVGIAYDTLAGPRP